MLSYSLQARICQWHQYTINVTAEKLHNSISKNTVLKSKAGQHAVIYPQTLSMQWTVFPSQDFSKILPQLPTDHPGTDTGTSNGSIPRLFRQYDESHGLHYNLYRLWHLNAYVNLLLSLLLFDNLPLYNTTSVSWHLQLKNGELC